MQLKSIGHRIRCLRVKQNMTQETLARLLCVTDSTVSSWERGRTEPDLTAIMMMANLFNVTLKFLITGVPD